DLARVAPGESLQLAFAQVLGVADHPALGAAEGEPGDGALPGHPHGQRLDLVKGDVGVIADAALGRSPGDVVLDAEALEHPNRAVVHLHREVDDELALDLPEDGAHAGVEPVELSSLVELPLRVAPRILGDSRWGADAGLHGTLLDLTTPRGRGSLCLRSV